MITGGEVRLLCYFENEQLLYKNTLPGLSECYYEDYVLAKEAIESDELSFYPNPVQGTLNISGNYSTNTRFRIVNVSGIICMEGILNTSSVDLSGLKHGTYLLNIVNKENQRTHKKFMKLE